MSSATQAGKHSIIPRRIFRGDTIGIAAPSGPFDIRRFRAGIETLTRLGFKVKVPDELFRRNGYLAGSDRHRAETLTRLFNDQSVHGIICARGGFGALKLLSRLDYEVIKKNPKIFIGYSDVSLLLSVFYTKCRLITFHGPMAVSLAQPSLKTRRGLMKAISSEKRIRLFPQRPVIIQPGYAAGPVVGGNLATLCHMAGTPYQPRFKSCILLLEETGEPVYRIDRMLTHMKMAGCFQGIAGLILGSFTDCGRHDDILGVVRNVFREFDIPITAGFDIGHGKDNLTIPIGLTAELDTDRGSLSFCSAATRPGRENL